MEYVASFVYSIDEAVEPAVCSTEPLRAEFVKHVRGGHCTKQVEYARRARSLQKMSQIQIAKLISKPFLRTSQEPIDSKEDYP